jgi:hypothetical protein
LNTAIQGIKSERCEHAFPAVRHPRIAKRKEYFEHEKTLRKKKRKKIKQFTKRTVPE